jgi:DNA invertase Pin-like site-specific DNA recombinase
MDLARHISESMNGALRAIAYVRADSESSEAARAQHAAIERWAQREGVDVRAWHHDVGIDGATPIAERPGLVAAYRALRAHDARVLVAADPDRFAHDRLVRWLIERAALTEGAAIRTADAPSALAQAQAPAQSYTRGAVDLARAYDRVMFRARVRAALAQKKARGERVGTIPYGYRLASDGVHVVPDEAEQAVVDTVRRLAQEGQSQRKIVAHLAACGVTGRTGAPLGQTQIANILRATAS